MAEAGRSTLAGGEGWMMAIGFDIREGSTQRGIVKAMIALALVFGASIEDAQGMEEKILAALFAIEGVIGLFVRDSGKGGR